MAPQEIDIDTVEAELRRWIEEARYESFDPYDGLSCSAPWSWARRWRPAARAWTQLVKASPINLRPWVGVRPRVHAKSLSDLASAALLRSRLGEAQARHEAEDLLQRLHDDVCAGFSGACWAFRTPYITRYITSTPRDPNLFWTINAANAFVESFEIEGRKDHLAVARSAIDFILKDLGCVDEADNGVWFRYFIGHDAAVYNVAALTGALLQRVAGYTGEPELDRLGARALRFVMRGQNADGSWFYARGEQGRWVDGFHTGYVLESLLQAALGRREADVEAALRRGVQFYLENLFTPEHLPRYAADRLYPIDVQNCAQAIQTLAKLCWLERRHLESAERVAQAVIAQLYRRTRPGPNGAGYFVMSRGRWVTNPLPAVRWGEAPMLLALTYLRAARRGLPPSWDRATAPASEKK